MKTIKNLPPQPASFYYPVEETKKMQETVPKTLFAKKTQNKTDFFLRKSRNNYFVLRQNRKKRRASF
jgi:hypothetical protein